MKLRKLAAALAIQGLLSGCYVVPVGPDGNYAIYIPTTPPPGAPAHPAAQHSAHPGQPGLPKEELKAMGEACGFDNARTFINSGNLLFTSDLAEGTVKQRVHLDPLP